MKCAVKSNARKDNPAAGHQLKVPRNRVVPPGYVGSGVHRATPAELCGLRVGNVDLFRCLVHIRGTRSPVPGYDGGGRQHVDGDTKSDAGQRSIPIPSWPCTDLAAMLAARNEGHLVVSGHQRFPKRAPDLHR
jgi:hypothetical protein